MEPLILQSDECQLGAAAVYRLAPKGQSKAEVHRDQLHLTASFSSEYYITFLGKTHS